MVTSYIGNLFRRRGMKTKRVLGLDPGDSVLQTLNTVCQRRLDLERAQDDVIVHDALTVPAAFDIDFLERHEFTVTSGNRPPSARDPPELLRRARSSD